MDWYVLSFSAINGILVGAMLGGIALGLSIIFGVLRIGPCKKGLWKFIEPPDIAAHSGSATDIPVWSAVCSFNWYEDVFAHSSRRLQPRMLLFVFHSLYL